MTVEEAIRKPDRVYHLSALREVRQNKADESEDLK